MNNKLTDSEIVKALEYCTNNDECDTDCPCFSEKESMCGNYNGLLKQILDLINRLQARVEKCEKVEHFADKTIETLQAENKNLQERNVILRGLVDTQKAYKECIEKAKSEIDSQSHSRSLEASGERFRIHKIFDNLLKELVGED